MTNFMLLKGFEVELFTGTYAGKNVGVASAITSASGCDTRLLSR
jgi:hypothetical protein